MGTPRLSASVDQMSNVQRAASCGGAIAHVGAREKEDCRSNAAQSGAIALTVVTQVAFSSGIEPLFASGGDTGPVCFEDVAQQVLFAQLPG
jgi:hypothetical protein